MQSLQPVIDEAVHSGHEPTLGIFTYANLRGNVIQARGFMTTWTWLRLHATRTGQRNAAALLEDDDEAVVTVQYFKTVGSGPECFAIVNDTVYFNTTLQDVEPFRLAGREIEADKWYPYRLHRVNHNGNNALRYLRPLPYNLFRVFVQEIAQCLDGEIRWGRSAREWQRRAAQSTKLLCDAVSDCDPSISVQELDLSSPPPVHQFSDGPEPDVIYEMRLALQDTNADSMLHRLRLAAAQLRILHEIQDPWSEELARSSRSSSVHSWRTPSTDSTRTPTSSLISEQE